MNITEKAELESFIKMKDLICKLDNIKKNNDFAVVVSHESSSNYFHFTLSKKISGILIQKEFELCYDFIWDSVEKEIDSFLIKSEKLEQYP